MVATWLLRHCWELFKIAVDSSPFGLSVFRDFDRRRGTKSPPDMQGDGGGSPEVDKLFPLSSFFIHLWPSKLIPSATNSQLRAKLAHFRLVHPSAHELLTRLWVDQMATEARNGLRTTHLPTAALFRWRESNNTARR